MKELPRETSSYRQLHEMMVGAARSQLLSTALSLKVFDMLDGQNYRDAAGVATALGAHPENTRHFLDALTVLGLLEKKSGSYRNLPLAEKFLRSESEYYLAPLLSLIKEMSVDSLTELESLVKNGPLPANEQIAPGSKKRWAEAARASASWVVGEMGCRVASIVSNLPGFGGFEKMLDLGGGHGMFALYIVAEHELMKGVVYDREPVAAVAREFIEKYGMRDRVEAVAGNYLSDDFGSGYDLVWASATLTFAKNDLDSLIAKVYESINEGGYFLSFQDGMTEDADCPDIMLGWLGSLLSTGGDMRLMQGEVAASMLRCGFSSVRSMSLATPMGRMDLDIARK